ncbi:hypothetical protein [Streptomyces sp. FH025]|uniref:hypothetical protein n=1 Tax=Streptomyces sp. FH025 TaxID=2815937 RepID=UPI001A9F8917|nr:hypothetical protein [Streptomyces sp. FH025]MBO1416270.1 hypothetical protein [Streptomyces sp. FH025]
MALVAILAYLAGLHASRSGGLVVVERWLNHPVLLVGVAAALIVVSLLIERESRTAWSQIGCVGALAVLVFGGLPIAVLSYVFSGDGRWVERKVRPEHPDRVLTVTDVAFSIDPIYHVELLSGTGWSARHWDLGTWETEGGDFTRVDWSGPNQITVTGERELRVFEVHPDGSLGAPRVTAR